MTTESVLFRQAPTTAPQVVPVRRPAPNRTIVRAVVGRTWLGASALGATFGVVAIASATSYVATFPTEASREAVAHGLSGSGGFSMVFGSTAHIGTVGGYTAYKTYAFLTTIGAVWAIMITARLLRGEEESGRWSLLLAGRTDAARATAATMLGILASAGIVFTCTFAAVALAGRSPSIGFGISGSALFAASTVLPIVVFTAAAAVASQLARSRHLASMIAVGAFACAFVLRMLGDSEAGLRWMLWTSPLGWSELIGPFTDDELPPLLAGVGLALVLGGVAVSLADRRDVGGAVFATDESHVMRPIGLGSPGRLAARLAAPVTVAWTVGILGAALVFGAVTRSVTRALDSSPGTSEVLRRLGGTSTGSYAFLAAAFVLLGTILALVPAHHVSMARDEERSGRLALLLVGPLSRGRWLTGRITLAAGGIVVLGPLAGIACWAGAQLLGADVAFVDLIEAGVVLVPVALVSLGVGAVVFAVVPRVAPASVEILVGWSLVVDLLGSLVSGFGPLTRLSLFHYAGSPLTAGGDWRAAAFTTAAALVLSIVAVVVFGRRDLSMN